MFLHHYCVHLAGPRHHRDVDGYPAGQAAARGVNGDIARHATAWRHELESGAAPASIARRLARKSLLAAAVDPIDPSRAAGLTTLLEWTDGDERTSSDDGLEVLDHTIAPIIARFELDIGLWP